MRPNTPPLLVRRLSAVVVVLALGALVGSSVSAAAAPSDNGAAVRAEHQRVLDHWTPERMATAQPRDYVRDPVTGRIELAPARTGTPGSQRTVMAADWTGGGLVERTTGQAFFELAGNGGTCSASVVEDTSTGTSLVLTAAHCVYDTEKNVFADFWLFVPGIGELPSSALCANTPYGCWFAQGITVPRAYADQDSFNDVAAANDVAFVTVGPGLPHGSQLDATVGSQQIAFTTRQQGTRVDLFGYRAAPSFEEFTLVHSAGRLRLDGRNDRLAYGAPSRLQNGASGGPWYAGFDPGSGTGVTMSVTSYAYVPQAARSDQAGQPALYGPIFTEQTAALHAAADGAWGNRILP